MCTAITYKTTSYYFGRNLDLEYSYDESVTVVPRNYTFRFTRTEEMSSHYAMIGMAYVVDEYPLFYDATNEAGLSMAGLNFPDNAYYGECGESEGGKESKTEFESSESRNVESGMTELEKFEPDAVWYEISPFEFIPWVLAKCANVAEAKKLLENTRVVAISYSKELPLTPLHWMIADKKESIVVEPLRDGLKVYDNPIGVLTNNPTFDWHMMNLNNYMNLSADEVDLRGLSECEAGQEQSTPIRNLDDESVCGVAGCSTIRPWDNMKFYSYSRGMGSLGLPGDWSSASRFVRAAYVRLNSVSGSSEQESVTQFMHILDSVAMPRGCVHMGQGKYEITVYSSCCNTDSGTYYYKTYDDGRIRAVDMRGENLDGEKLVKFPVKK